jgi:ribonuclease P protein component
VSDGRFTIVARPSQSGRARLGLAISRRCARTAVARNRLKRIVRESFRLHAAAGLPPADYVVMCRPAAAEQPNAALFESLAELWRRAQRRLRRPA